MKRHLVGSMALMLCLTLSASAATLELVDDFSGATLDTGKWDVSSENGSVTIVGGQMKCRTDSVSTPPYGYAYAGLKMNGSTELSLSMFENQQFTLAVDFQVSNVTTNQYGNGVQLRLAGSSTVLNGVNIYGGLQASLLGNMTSDYSWNGIAPVFGKYHLELTLSVGGAVAKVYGFDAAATGPGDYAGKTPVDEWTLSKASQPVLSSVDDKFEVFLCGSISRENSKVSEVHFDNVYTSVPEPATLTLLGMGLVGMLARK